MPNSLVENLRLTVGPQETPFLEPLDSCAIAAPTAVRADEVKTALDAILAKVDRMFIDSTPVEALAAPAGAGKTTAIAHTVWRFLTETAELSARSKPLLVQLVAPASETLIASSDLSERVFRYLSAQSHRRSAVGIPTEVLAVTELAQWLEISQTEAIAIAGLPERTFYWRKNHPASAKRTADSDRLSRIRALVRILRNDVGPKAAVRWFKSGEPSRLRQLRSDPSSLDRIEEEGLGAAMDALQGRVIRATRQVGDQLNFGDAEDAEEFARAEMTEATEAELAELQAENADADDSE